MIYVAWTTVTSREEAVKLASGAIAEKLAVCAQIDGPILSVYCWQGKVQQEEEFRITFKLLPQQEKALQEWIEAHHSYDTPQWIVVASEKVSGKYLIWAQDEAS